MRVSQSFIDAPSVRDDNALTADILLHLQDALPEVITAYPPGYLIALVRHSARLGRDRFGLDEIAALRLFVRLRWDIAPGYYHEPTIARLLADPARSPMARFEALLGPEYEHVWLDAMQYDGPAFWRGEYSDGFGDVRYGAAPT